MTKEYLLNLLGLEETEEGVIEFNRDEDFINAYQIISNSDEFTLTSSTTKENEIVLVYTAKGLTVKFVGDLNTELYDLIIEENE